MIEVFCTLSTSRGYTSPFITIIKFIVVYKREAFEIIPSEMFNFLFKLLMSVNYI